MATFFDDNNYFFVGNTTNEIAISISPTAKTDIDSQVPNVGSPQNKKPAATNAAPEYRLISL